MRCRRCSKEIGEIVNAVTTSGTYATDGGGTVPVALEDGKMVIFKQSAVCNDCFTWCRTD